MYNCASMADAGTLFQLRNLIKRRNVVKNPKDNFTACEEFFLLIVEAHIVAAALKVFSMATVNDSPSKVLFPEGSCDLDSLQRRSIMMSAIKILIRKYVDIAYGEKPSQTGESNGVGGEAGACLHGAAQREECDHGGGSGDAHVPGDDQARAWPHLPVSRGGDGSTNHTPLPDHIYEYACGILSHGLMYMEFRDAIREGDGSRILRCWRYFMILFKKTRRTNYSVEAFNLLAQYHFMLSPREAMQLLWSRTVNVHGRAGRNIACDLHMEHLNREAKKGIAGTGANITDESVKRIGRSIGQLVPILNNFDIINHIKEPSDRHSRRSTHKDMGILLKQLEDTNVFNVIPGRVHRSFPKFKANPVRHDSVKDLTEWMRKRLKILMMYS